MPFALVSLPGDLAFRLRPSDTAPLLVGRGTACDIPIADTTVSRRHAELTVAGSAVDVRDLGSSNGTFVNGARVESGRVALGDVVTFGRCAFRMEWWEDPSALDPAVTAEQPGAGVSTGPERSARRKQANTLEMPAVGAPALEPTIVRERAVPPSGGTPPALRSSGPDSVAHGPSLSERKLALLLEISTSLARAGDLDSLLDRTARLLMQAMDVDRVAVLLADADDPSEAELSVRISRDRSGADVPRPVPRSIARRVMGDRVAVLTRNAAGDARFGGESIVAQQVRSAICAPLVASDGAALGALYVDNRTAAGVLSEDDLDFLVAFSGIAAVAIENNQLASRVRRQALVRSNFERYFTPALAARIAGAAETPTPGGEKRRVAILFSDIRGFTALAEQMPPSEVAALLSEYFTAMVDCVFRHGGTLDKFVGDALLAQWGAPVALERDADHAVNAAVDMMRALDVLNGRWRAQGRPELAVGIGLNAGDVFAGNIGSPRRLEFTIIGDAVNVASRICTAAAGGEILVTDTLRRALRSAIALEERPHLAIRGTSQSVRLYRLLLS